MLHHVSNGATVEDVSSQAEIVTMGINPSRDRLHLGHYLTLLQAGKALHAQPDAQGIFFVDDREHHHKLANGVNDDTFRLPGYRATQHVHDLMYEFMSRVADSLGDKRMLNRLNIKPMSNYMGMNANENDRLTKKGTLVYDQLWQHRENINALFEFSDSNSMQFVRPFCRDCKYSVNSDERIRAIEQGMLTNCLVPQCSTERMFVRPSQGHMNWSMHYAVDPIRDVILADFQDKKVLHVFGGDYGIPWGLDGRPKAARMSALMDKVAPEMVDHFVGPMLTRDGQKLAKSNGDAHEVPTIGYLDKLLSENEPVIEVAA